MFNYNFTNANKDELIITLEGEFDTAGAQSVQEKLEAYDIKKIEKIIFDLTNATIMASSGLRVIFFAKDKIKENMKVELKGAQGLVAKVIKMSGIKKFVDVI